MKRRGFLTALAALGAGVAMGGLGIVCAPPAPPVCPYPNMGILIPSDTPGTPGLFYTRENLPKNALVIRFKPAKLIGKRGNYNIYEF